MWVANFAMADLHHSKKPQSSEKILGVNLGLEAVFNAVS